MSRDWDCHYWMHYPNPYHKHKNGKWKCVNRYECIRDLVEPNTNYYDKATHCKRKDKMYKSPVEVICGDVESKVKEQQENLIKETLHKCDLIKRPWIVFASPSDAKAIKEALPRIEEEVVIQETDSIESGKAVAVKREEFEKWATWSELE